MPIWMIIEIIIWVAFRPLLVVLVSFWPSYFVIAIWFTRASSTHQGMGRIVEILQIDSFKTIIYGLTHWGRVTYICVDKLTIIGSDNGVSPGQRQAIIWTNVGILSIGPLGTNFSEIVIKFYIFSLKKMHLKMASGKWRPFCLGLNELIQI